MRTQHSHHQSNVGLLLSFILLLVSSCKHDPTGPVDVRPLITSSDYRNVVLSLTDYDVVRITHQAGLDLRSPSVFLVNIGVKNGSRFNPLLSSLSTYDPNTQTYIIHFDFTLRMDSSKVNAPLTIRYVSGDSNYSDIDTTVALYKFPYSSAEVFADSSNLGTNPSNLQGISFSGSVFYFHPLDEGLFAYDPASRSNAIRWNGYYRGSHIASDSNFVFCDITHQQIARYNLVTSTANSPVPDLGSVVAIDGMAMCNHHLYVLVTSFPEYLKTFSLDGALLDSLSFATYPSYSPYFMAVYDSIVYSKDETFRNDTAGDQISRFDLRTKTLLPNVSSPAKQLLAITIYAGKLYYCNMSKDFVGMMPVGDLLPVTSIRMASTSKR